MAGLVLIGVRHRRTCHGVIFVCAYAPADCHFVKSMPLRKINQAIDFKLPYAVDFDFWGLRRSKIETVDNLRFKGQTAG